ncbi:TraX family protein [Escherichia coli]
MTGLPYLNGKPRCRRVYCVNHNGCGKRSGRLTVLTVGLVSCAGKSLPRFWPGDFFPTFYACHLAVLGVLAL